MLKGEVCIFTFLPSCIGPYAAKFVFVEIMYYNTFAFSSIIYTYNYENNYWKPQIKNLSDIILQVSEQNLFIIFPYLKTQRSKHKILAPKLFCLKHNITSKNFYLKIIYCNIWLCF